jgi:hypothetical protein
MRAPELVDDNILGGKPRHMNSADFLAHWRSDRGPERDSAGMMRKTDN